MLPPPFRLQARLPGLPTVGATCAFACAMAWGLASIPRMLLSMGFRASVSFLPAIRATRLLTFTLAGLAPAEHASLRWTHNRTCGRVGRQRVILVDTFPTAPLRTPLDRFRITRLSGNLYVGGRVRHIARIGCAHGTCDRPPGISAGGRPSGASRVVSERILSTPDRRACGHDALR
jgi:hypothetical protein